MAWHGRSTRSRTGGSADGWTAAVCVSGRCSAAISSAISAALFGGGPAIRHPVFVTAASPESERSGLIEFLDCQREAVISKLDGISEKDALRTPTASSLSL